MFQPFLATYLRYISKSIAEKFSASSPPAPEIMVRIALPRSYFPNPSFSALNSEILFITSCALALSFQKSGACISFSRLSMSFSISFVSRFINFWSHLSGLNRGPPLYESGALPTELRWHYSLGADSQTCTDGLALHFYLYFAIRITYKRIRLYLT